MLAVAAGMAVLPTPAQAIGVAVPLGTADSFAVLAGETVTNTGSSTITGNVGVHPGKAVTGFPPGTVNGSIHRGDALAKQAKTDLTTAYNNAAGQPYDASVSDDLGGRTLKPGVYRASSSIGLTGTLTLDAEGDPNAVWIFQVGSTLTTASASRVRLINGAAPCNVFWKIGSSATLGTGSTFVGNILALTSITVTTGVTIDGRALARNGAVTLDDDTITRKTCSTGGTSSGTTSGTSAGSTSGSTAGSTSGTTAGTTAGSTSGSTSGTTSGTTAGSTSGTTAGTTAGGDSGGNRPPVGGVGTGSGGAARGLNATEITVGVLLIGLSLIGAGVFVVRRRALTAS
ncbi:ice-binding family protein [Streptomyces montanus]|nr:ice-binding family protein [Streptomyces montanus]